jgi:hypothetical protein
MLQVQVHRYRVTGAKCLSEPKHLKNEWCGGWWRTHYGGHPAKDNRPTRPESDPQRRALGEQSQKQPEKAGDEHSEESGADPMTDPVIRRVSVRVMYLTSLVLRCVLSATDALRKVAEQVHESEDSVTEEQRADEQHG